MIRGPSLRSKASCVVRPGSRSPPCRSACRPDGEGGDRPVERIDLLEEGAVRARRRAPSHRGSPRDHRTRSPRSKPASTRTISPPPRGCWPRALAQKLGVVELVDEHVRLSAGVAGSANCGVKAMTVLGAMLTGADSIDEVDVLRAGAAPELFDQLRAPSTIGTWLRGFIWATVRMMDKVSRQVLVGRGLPGSAPTCTRI